MRGLLACGLVNIYIKLEDNVDLAHPHIKDGIKAIVNSITRLKTSFYGEIQVILRIGRTPRLSLSELAQFLDDVEKDNWVVVEEGSGELVHDWGCYVVKVSTVQFHRVHTQAFPFHGSRATWS